MLHCRRTPWPSLSAPQPPLSSSIVFPPHPSALPSALQKPPPEKQDCASLAEADTEGGRWQLLANTAASTFREAVESEGQLPGSFSLEVTLPLSVALRDVAVFHYLASKHPGAIRGG